MSNKYRPYVLLIPEDDANRQLANGFQGHYAVDDRRLDIRRPAGGWREVLDVFEIEYLPLLRNNTNAHVVMLIDFDGFDDRMAQIDGRIPDDVKDRVFVIGSKERPETLRRELKMSWEKIGRTLAEECHGNAFELWRHPHLIHNELERQRLESAVKRILFHDAVAG